MSRHAGGTSVATETETRPDVGYTHEGGGVIARCTGCGWEVWKPDEWAAESGARDDHKKCRPGDVAFHARRQRALRAGHL